ncbi:metal ABC transporter permease [Cardiobacteriaceae bacterium TAE3-ERU3]|nr:metal ABC transporter permease [Cardiobacteriaceae bacterium TAE3-ERU3]
MFIQFVLIPSLCALTASCACAPLGCLLCWRRLIYFGEALAHSSLLGIALSLYFDWPLAIGIWAITFILVIALYLLKYRSNQDSNNILGTLSHFALALGVLLISSMEGIRTDLMSYLFGDILATTGTDLIIIAGVTFVSLLLLRLIWQKLLLLTINPMLAYSENTNLHLIELLYLLILGTFIGVMVQYFGLLLIIALLIIPANTANRLAKTPEQSVVIALIIGLSATAAGTALAWQFDFPVAPSIVSIAGILYFLSLPLAHWVKQSNRQ